MPSRCPLAALCLALLACGDPTASGDVLLISVDTLRADHLESYGYERSTSPALQRWFQDGAIFERAYTTHSSTPPSVVSLLSGRYPPEHRVRLFYQLVPETTRLLPDLLPAATQSVAVVSNYVLTDAAMGMGSRFDHYDDRVEEPESERDVFERRAEETTDAAIDWLEDTDDRSRPLLLWVHYIDPHWPYLPASNAASRFEHEGHQPLDPKRMPAYGADPEVYDALDYVDRYDDEIHAVDAAIERLLTAFDSRRSLARTLVIFTADHGETLTERAAWFRHGSHVHEELIRVPLMLRGPGVERGHHGDPVSIVDVVPTVLDHLGIPHPDQLPGRSLLEAESGAMERMIFAEGGRTTGLVRAAIQGNEKWIALVPAGETKPAARLHLDLARDPQEREPRARATLPHQLVTACLLDPDPGGQPEDPEQGSKPEPGLSPRTPPEAIEALRALGYVE